MDKLKLEKRVNLFDTSVGDNLVHNITDTRFEKILPIYKSSTYPGHIEWNIAPNGLQYLSLDIDLMMEGQVVAENGDDISGTDNVAIINALGYTAFENFVVKINGVVVQDSGFHAAYQHYIDCLLNTTGGHKRDVLRYTLPFEYDTPNSYDSCDAAFNKGRVFRRSMVSDSKCFRLYFRLPIQLSTSGKLLPPNTGMNIRYVATIRYIIALTNYKKKMCVF